MHYKLNSKFLHSQATETVNNAHIFKKGKARAGIQIPEKDFSKRTTKATGFTSRTIRRVSNK